MWNTFKAEFKALWNSRLRFASWIILLVMPLIYGLLFLSSFWAPFKHTDRLPIAIVNMEQETKDASGNIVPSHSEALVNKLTGTDASHPSGSSLTFRAGSSEYKLRTYEAKDIYDRSTTDPDAEKKKAEEIIKDKVNDGTYSAVFVIPSGYNEKIEEVHTQFITELLQGKPNFTNLAKILASFKPITFYNSFKTNYVAGEMTNMGSTLYSLLADVIYPDLSSITTKFNEAADTQLQVIAGLVKSFRTHLVDNTGKILTTVIAADPVKAVTTLSNLEHQVQALMGALNISLDPTLVKAVQTKINGLKAVLQSGDNAKIATALTGLQAELTQLNTKIHSFTQAELDSVVNSIKDSVLSDMTSGNILVDHEVYGKREGVSGKRDILNTYGYGLSPYFLSIILWAGALLMAFLFPNKRYIKTEGTFKNFWGKSFVWILTGWIQVILLFTIISIPGIFGTVEYHDTSGNIVKIKQCINLGENKNWQLIFFGIFISTVFMITVRGILYTLRVADVGLFLVVILLILQLTSSGGTFPVQMQPKFFQFMHKILPFTYTVNGIKELFWDTNVRQLFADMGVLLIFPIIFTATALVSNYIWDKKTVKIIDGQKIYRSMDKNVGSL